MTQFTSNTSCTCKCMKCKCDELIQQLFSSEKPLSTACCCDSTCQNSHCIGKQISNLYDFQIELAEKPSTDDSKLLLENLKKIDGIQAAAFDYNHPKILNVSGTINMKAVCNLLKPIQITKAGPQKVVTFQVLENGMKCGGCAKKIQSAISEIPGTSAVWCDLEKKLVYVFGNVHVDAIQTALEKIGKKVQLYKDSSTVDYVFKVDGMKCNGCIANITKSVQQLPGIANVVVDLEKQQCCVSVISNEGNADVSEIIEAIAKVGYRATLYHSVPPSDSEKIVFNINGMKCGGCSKKVINKVSSIKGVYSVDVDLKQKQATVSVQPSLKIGNEILEAIKSLGYEVSIANSEAEKPSTVVFTEIELEKPEEEIEIKVSDSKEDLKTCELSIDGMSCSSCVSKIEQNIANLKGVHSVSVNLLVKKGEIVYDENLISEEKIINHLGKLGFPSKSITSQKLKPGEMDLKLKSQVDESEIENLIQKIQGVKNVTIKKGIIHVDFDEMLTSKREIKEYIEENGNCETELIVPDTKGLKESILREAEARRWRNLFIFSAIFTIPTMIFAMIFGHIDYFRQYIMMRVHPSLNLSIEALVLLILVTPVQFIGGAPFYVLAFKSLRRFSADMNVLVVLATTEAYVYSLFAIIYGMVDESFEASAALIMFLLLGRWLECIAKGNTSRALVKLMDLQPTTALLVENTREREIPIELVHKGDVLKVIPGSKIPTDGVIIDGTTSVDESMITGESIPVSKKVNDKVIGGTMNVEGLIHIRATHVGAESTLSSIAKLVEEAQTQKPSIQAFADKISGYFTYVVITLSLGTFIVWIILGYTNAYPAVWRGNLNPIVFALIFSASTVVIACPCALGLATPTAIMVGTGVGAKFGVLIKGGKALETAKRATAVLFDKTGTLTKGELRVNDIVILDETYSSENKKQDLLTWIGSTESGSDHPIAKSLVQFAKKHNGGKQLLQPSNFTNVAGRGIKCKIGEKLLHVGNKAFLAEEGISLQYNNEAIRPLHEAGNTLVYVAVDNKIAAALGLTDTIKDESKAVVQKLQSMGIRVYMVTGDNKRAAAHVASQVGIPKENVFAEVTPSGKTEKVKELQSQRERVIMIGDGINDSPSLTQADVGIAIGEGTDVAIECADIVLMKNNLKGVVTALDLSRKTYRRIIINFVWAFVYNVVSIPLAMGLFYPLILMQIPPWVAGIAMVLSSISVLLSSLFLKFYKKPNF